MSNIFEALQDHFQQSCLHQLDKNHFDEMDVSKVILKSFHSDPGPKTGNINLKFPVQKSEAENHQKILKRYPSFDPVFMKV